MSALHNTSDTARQSASNTRRTNTGTRTSTISRSSAQQSSNRKMSSGRQDSRRPASKPAAPREKRYEIPRHFKMFRPGEPMPPSFEVLWSWKNTVSATSNSYRLAQDEFISSCRCQGANGAVNIYVDEVHYPRHGSSFTVCGTPVIFGVASQRGQLSSHGLLDYYWPNRPKTSEEIEEYRALEQKQLDEDKAQRFSRKLILSLFFLLILTTFLLWR